MELVLGTSVPPYWRQVEEQIAKVPDDLKKDALLGVQCYCPLAISWESEDRQWFLPYDPVVTVRGKNEIVKRSVLKVKAGDKNRRGTVKELWSQGDYEVVIAGILMSGEPGKLPKDDIRKLRAYCEGRESVEVDCALLTLFGIRRVAIESFEFPHTAGMGNQMYSLTCSSDDFYKESLLIAE